MSLFAFVANDLSFHIQNASRKKSSSPFYNLLDFTFFHFALKRSTSLGIINRGISSAWLLHAEWNILSEWWKFILARQLKLLNWSTLILKLSSVNKVRKIDGSFHVGHQWYQCNQLLYSCARNTCSIPKYSSNAHISCRHKCILVKHKWILL